MVKLESKKITIGNIVIDNAVVVSMTATVYEDGEIIFSSSIQNEELYEKNIETINNEIQEFKQSIRSDALWRNY